MMKKRAWLLPAVLCVLLLLLVLGWSALGCAMDHPARVDAAIEREREKLTQPLPTAPAAEEMPYESPVDFAALQAENPDIFAWLDIPGTDISYPVLQHPTNNGYYLNHGENGEPSSAGALYVEDYNRTDFSDPAVAIYGHQLRSGAYFGNLQEAFETEDGFAALRELVIYLPDRELRYQVFAAVPYNNTHLLYTYHFGNPYEFSDFMARIREVRSFSAHLEERLLPQFGDRLLILSTCLRGDSSRRYLVMGSLAKEETHAV